MLRFGCLGVATSARCSSNTDAHAVTEYARFAKIGRCSIPDTVPLLCKVLGNAVTRYTIPRRAASIEGRRARGRGSPCSAVITDDKGALDKGVVQEVSLPRNVMKKGYTNFIEITGIKCVIPWYVVKK